MSLHSDPSSQTLLEDRGQLRSQSLLPGSVSLSALCLLTGHHHCASGSLQWPLAAFVLCLLNPLHLPQSLVQMQLVYVCSVVCHHLLSVLMLSGTSVCLLPPSWPLMGLLFLSGVLPGEGTPFGCRVFPTLCLSCSLYQGLPSPCPSLRWPEFGPEPRPGLSRPQAEFAEVATFLTVGRV